MRCRYDEPWVGQCRNEAIKGSKNCKEHAVLCSVCGKRLATHGCSCAGSWVCGTPLCGEKDCVDKHWSRH